MSKENNGRVAVPVALSIEMRRVKYGGVAAYLDHLGLNPAGWPGLSKL